MKKVIALLTVVIIVFTSCNSKKKDLETNQSDIHKIIAQEVLQVKDYTYIRAEEDGKEKWIAAPLFQAEVGKTYYFKKGLEMPNFESKELNKTFETIYFLDQISTDPNFVEVVETLTPTSGSIQTDVTLQMAKPVIKKEDVKIEESRGVATIASIYKDLKSFEGKVIKVKGKVTKFNPAIMNKNWIHIQDGTDFNGEFDLTITTLDEFNVGDVVTLEGKVSLDKDFGFGYFYKLILEDAVLVK